MEDLPLEERLNRSFDQQEKAEEKALELEKLIKSYNGAAPLMPARKYGQPVEDLVPIGVHFLNYCLDRLQILMCL